MTIRIFYIIAPYTPLSRTNVGADAMAMPILQQRLKECRKKLEYKQIEVATYSDITERAYQNYELGRREPKLSILMRIAQTFHVSVDYLVGLTDEPKPYPPPKNSQES